MRKPVLHSFLALSLLTGITFMQCKKNTPQDYLMFGHFFGMCGGPHCIDVYRLDSRILLENDVDNYPAHDRPYEGSFHQVSDVKFQIAKDLFKTIPAGLADQDGPMIGGPDTHDQGGIYLELMHHGARKFWLIDNDVAAVPEYLRPFLDDVRATLGKLK